MGNYDQGCGKGTAKRRGLHRQAPPSRSPAGAPPAGSPAALPGRPSQLVRIFNSQKFGTKKCVL